MSVSADNDISQILKAALWRSWQTAADCCPYQKAHKRLNTIHLLLCGGTFELARKHARNSERCLQLWISDFNEEDVDGIT